MRILLADDHTLVRETLSDFLQELDSDVTVLEAGTLEEAAAIAAGETTLAMIILDLLMPGMKGMEGLRKMVETYPDIPVVLLTGSTDRNFVLDALSIGARGYIPKTIRGKAMLSALRLVLSGETYIPPSAIARAPGISDSLDTGPTRDGQFDDLTARENEVLEQLIEGFQNKQIAHELGLKEVTVKVHLQHIYQKLGVSNRAQAVAKALRAGYFS